MISDVVGTLEFLRATRDADSERRAVETDG